MATRIRDGLKRFVVTSLAQNPFGAPSASPRQNMLNSFRASCWKIEGGMALKSSVTDRQIFFLLFLTLTAYTIISIPKVIAQGVGPDRWVALTITSLFFAVFAVIIVRLNSAFPGMMLFDYCQRIAGRFLTMSSRRTSSRIS
jgi:hypothetical protein